MEPSQPTGKNCLNCGTDLSGRYCSNCGQDSQEFRKSIWKVFFQFFETFTDFDNKVWSSLVPLIFRPGYLTVKFLEGKRKQFLNPIQMYAFFSFLFFLIVFYVPENGGSSNSREMVSGMLDGLTGRVDSVRKEGKAISDSIKREIKMEDTLVRKKKEQVADDFDLEFGDLGKSVAKYDSTQNALPPEKRDGLFEQTVVRKLIRINQRIKQKDKSIIPAFVEEFKGNLPNLIILLLPFFALILKLLYLRRNFYYVEHLIFSIHLHCFAFFLFSVSTLVIYFFPYILEDMSIPLLVLLIYIYFALKAIYKQGWFKTFVKFNLLGASYSLLLIIGFVVNIFVAALLID